MDGSQSAQPSEQGDARADLALRVLDNMTFSTADSPLTRPLSPVETSSPVDRAVARFAVEGNAVVTGGAGVLGLQASRALLEHGLSAVCLMDLPSTLRTSAERISELRAHFPDRIIIQTPVDVTSSAAVESAFDTAVSAMPGTKIDILCCFAGIVGVVHSLNVSQADFQKVIDVNLTGSFLCAQAAAKHMIQSGTGGSILFTASISAHATNYPQPQVAYNVSKAGVKHMTRNLAAEWAVYGIRVNSISPGYMDTVLNAGDNLSEVRAVWANRCPMGRMGAVEEITGPVVLLCSRTAGRYMTGADLLVDGGAMCL